MTLFKLWRLLALVLLPAALNAAAAMQAAHAAEALGTRPVTIIIPLAPGGPNDVEARIYAARMTSLMGGLQFLIDYKPGASGNIGADAVAKATDGHTLLMGANTMLMASQMYKNVPFNPIKDFAPISMAAYGTLMLVAHPKTGIKSMAEFIAQAKSRPGSISFGSPGVGTPHHMAMELFKAQTGIDMVHVAYRGNPLAMIDVIGGHVPVFFDFVLTGAPHVRSGAVRALATTGAQRSSILPDLPTVIEAGIPGFEASTWFGVYAPAGTPKEMVTRMSDEIAAVLAAPNVKKRLAELGVEPMQGGPAALAEITRSDLAKWGPVIQKAGLKLE